MELPKFMSSSPTVKGRRFDALVSKIYWADGGARFAVDEPALVRYRGLP